MQLLRRGQVLGNITPNNANKIWLARERSKDIQNLLTNSVFNGASGSVSGADWVTPTGYSEGFWPPDDAIALGDGKIQFIANANRGYLAQSIVLPPGTRICVSITVSDLITPSTSRPISMATDVTLIDSSNCNSLSNGRKFAIYEVTGANAQVRIGAGTTTNTDQNMVLSDPMINIGNKPYNYIPTE